MNKKYILFGFTVFFFYTSMLPALLPRMGPTLTQAEENWKEAYLQGQKLLVAGKWEQAIRFFEAVLKVKDRDDKSVRLYGMGFGYFPHRDKGIAHYQLGQWEEAIKELRISIQQSKSDQAVQYLDLATKALEKSQQEEGSQASEGGDWKEFYLQGLGFMDSQRWSDAVRAFEKALQLKDKEDESLKLYGMRYGYFPHREKGIAHYRLEEWESAVRELETSLAQVPSARASEYLDLAKNKKVTLDTPSIFRGNWWNHYERGTLLAEKGAWEQAIDDYRQALSKQDKGLKDAFRVRTYGLRFIDYFPHRELGVAYYETGQFEKAVRELEASLAMTYTAKAAFFLNQARKELLKTSAADRKPPRITISTPSQNQITNLFSVEVAGVVEDENFVSAVWVNDRLLFIELAEKKVPFSQTIPLTLGENRITVAAADLAGNKTSKTLTLKVDREGPTIVLDNFADGEVVKTPQITLKGLLTDDTGVIELIINGETLPIRRGMDVEFSRKLNLRKGENSIKVRAKDAVGNTTEDVIRLIHDPALPEPKIKKTERSPDAPYAEGFDLQKAQDEGTGGGSKKWGGNGTWKAQKVAAHWPITEPKDLRAAAEKAEESPKEAPSGTRPPLVKLKDLEDEQTVFLEKFFIEGKAVALGSAQVDVVLINDEPLETKPGKSLIFSYLVELKEGKNLFTITVIDTQGNQTEKKLNIIRQIPAVNQIGSRMSLAVFPFEQKGPAAELAGLVYDTLINAFIEQERFKIVGRKEELQAALEELKLSQTGLVDELTAVKLGKIVAAEAVIIGSVAITDKHIEVVARLVNTETIEIMASKVVYDEHQPDTLLEKINFLMEGLALKFKQEFPLMEGAIIKVEGSVITVDLGMAQRIRKDMKFIVFQEGEVLKHTVTGKILGAETQQLGEAKVEQVFENFSKGQVIATLSPDKAIKPLDKVITK